jgi:DNA-binding Xre family transcriptional regulator
MTMAISYNKLWKMLIDRKMSKTDLRIKTELSTATLAKMGKDQQVSMDSLLRICKILNCDIADIMCVENMETL